jgi:hypothetical protein
MKTTFGFSFLYDLSIFLGGGYGEDEYSSTVKQIIYI